MGATPTKALGEPLSRIIEVKIINYRVMKSNKFTSQMLVDVVLNENMPLDYSWLSYQRKNISRKQLVQNCKDMIISYNDCSNCSANLVGRATNILFNELYG